MKQSHELVFIPLPLVSHFVVALEMAKLITRRDPGRVSVTILLMKFESESFDAGQDTGSDSIRLLTLPAAGLSFSGGAGSLFFEFVEGHAPLVRSAVHDLLTRSCDSVRLAGFVLDMFCTQMIDVANEFGVPSYLIYTSGAASLGFLLHVQSLHDHQGLNLEEFKDSDTELEVPSFAYPVPGKVFPLVVTSGKEGRVAEIFLYHVRRFRKFKGILVNSFLELEPDAVHSFSVIAAPKAYVVGPILNPGSDGGPRESTAIMSWLDDQPPSSVVFLCFGSMGAFGGDQIKEIARGLERSGHRFLWSLRRPPADGAALFPTDYGNVEDALPEGFLHRTAGIGKVIGWAPQMAILAHPAVGGFVSHCGWNSTLESLWHGVPVATWPLFAEQQLNAFQLVRELELAVEIRIDYCRERDSECVVSGEEIEIGVKKLMNMESKVRKKRVEMKEISRKVMKEGGSSHISLGCFIEDVVNNQ